MKKVIIVAGVVSMVFSACETNKLATYNDDVYANPTEERLEKARLAAEKKKKEEELAKKEAEERAAELAAQKAKDDANPLYKDPVYDKDDYYDYQYASRIRRFNNPVCGVGYYDNYYTNYYWYNGNPDMYGTSIYTSYNYWGPSYNSYGCWPSNYFGISYGWGYPNYGWGNPYAGAYWQGYYNGYNNGFYNGYYGYPYGWGYNSPYYNNWGYYNQFDVNSAYNKPTNAPRGSHDGGNSGRTSSPGKYTDGLAQKYIQEVQVAQANTPKFDSEIRTIKSSPKNNSSFETINNGDTKPNGNNSNPKNTYNSVENINSGHGNNNIGTVTNPKNNTNSNPTIGTQPQYNNDNNNPKVNGGVAPINTEPVKPVKTPRNNNEPKINIFETTKPNLNNNTPAPTNSSPRGGNSGGGTRPR